MKRREKQNKNELKRLIRMRLTLNYGDFVDALLLALITGFVGSGITLLMIMIILNN